MPRITPEMFTLDTGETDEAEQEPDEDAGELLARREPLPQETEDDGDHPQAQGPRENQWRCLRRDSDKWTSMVPTCAGLVREQSFTPAASPKGESPTMAFGCSCRGPPLSYLTLADLEEHTGKDRRRTSRDDRDVRRDDSRRLAAHFYQDAPEDELVPHVSTSLFRRSWNGPDDYFAEGN